MLYVASQAASTLLMPNTMDPRQRYMFLALPFIFVIFVIRFPVGLMLYWITTNLWTVGQQTVLRKLMPPPDSTAIGKGRRRAALRRAAAARPRAAAAAEGRRRPKGGGPEGRRHAQGRWRRQLERSQHEQAAPAVADAR